jgi:hypothetical protein
MGLGIQISKELSIVMDDPRSQKREGASVKMTLGFGRIQIQKKRLTNLPIKKF